MNETILRFWSSLVQFGFRLLYNELAWSYDVVSWFVSFGRWRDWQRTAIDFLDGGRILEIAHGPGHLLPELANGGNQVVGLDLSPAMIRLAQRKVSGIKEPVALVRSRAELLPMADCSFNAVVSTFPALFILNEVTATAIHRVLVPGGRLVIVLAAQVTGFGPAGAFLEWLYHITGQRTARDATLEEVWGRFKRPFAAAGFDMHLEIVRLPHSLVYIAVGQR